MHLARFASRPLAWPSAIFALMIPPAIALLMTVHPARAATVGSRILIDPVGENNADFFGTSVAWVGDVNVDGYDDLLIGAFRYPEIASLGRAYLYFGGPAIDTAADLVIAAPAGDTGWFGISVASAGDFNGDGYPDFIVGAQQSGYPGKAFVYYGGPTLDATPDLTLIGESTGSMTMFGASVASAGDLNEDGFDDVIVGAPQYGSGGRAYVFFGSGAPDAIPDAMFTAPGAFDQLGYAVGGAGDMNGDGHPDVFASAPYNDAAAVNAGAIYVWFGGPAFDATTDLTLFGSGVNERLGNAANAGDVNGDGFSDLVGAGKDHVSLWFGGSPPNSTPDLTLARTYASVAGAGDVNGDGIDDFVVGAPYDGTAGVVAGRVSVYFGGSAVDSLDDLHFMGDQSGRSLGLCVAGGGRVDGPGSTDLIASSYEDPDATGYNKGRVYVIANSPDLTAVPAIPIRGLSFLGARPNPAQGGVNFVFALDHAVPVRIIVYDVAGRVVARPIEDEWMVGPVTRTWDPGALPRGVYYVQTTLDNRVEVRKVIWMGQRR